MESSLPAVMPQQPALQLSAHDSSFEGQQVAFALEHKLVEHIARLQVQGSYGHELGNPAALGHELLRVLKVTSIMLISFRKMRREGLVI